MQDAMPTLRHHPRGDCYYLDLDPATLASPMLPLIRLELTRNIPVGFTDWEPGGGTLWIAPQWSETVLQRARGMWPDLATVAVAHRGGERRGALGEVGR